MTVPADHDGLEQQIHAVTRHLAHLMEDRSPRTWEARTIHQAAINSANGRLRTLQAKKDAL